MSVGPRLDLRTSQTLVISPQLQAAIKLLTLSNLELMTEISAELDRNPLLEMAEDGDGGQAEAESEPAPAADRTDMDQELAMGDGMERGNDQDVDYVEERFHHDTAADSGHGSEGGEELNFDSFAAEEMSLAEVLQQQAQRLAGVDLAVALHLISLIDEAGYLTEGVEEIAARLGLPEAEVERVLGLVQTFEPTGVGARDLAECIALQAKEADRYDPCMAALLDNLDLLAAGRIAQLQRICGVDDEDMADMIRELRGYDPKPGARFGSSRVDAVTPDVFVARTAKGWAVEINTGSLPRVLVDRTYHAELAASAKDKASKAWVTDNLASANWLVKALDQRQRTIVKVATEIVKQQEAFFLHGVAHLRPLVLRTVADAVGMHESTVSRVTSNKYLSCSRGMFELKYFFTSGIASADGGEGASALAVKAAIKTLISQEAADAILSDDTLVEMLKGQGFDLARRTVAKYREAIGIGSSVQRRRARAIEAKAA